MNMQSQSIIIWHRPAERMPTEEQSVLFAVGTAVISGIFYRENFRASIFTYTKEDVDWWAELPQVPEVNE